MGDSSSRPSLHRKLYFDFLMDIARHDPTNINLQHLVREFTLWDIVKSSKQHTAPHIEGNADSWVGLLPEKDTLRFGLSSRPELSPSVQQRLADELESLLILISDFFHADDIGGITEDQRRQLALSLPEHIQARQQEAALLGSDLDAACERVMALVATVVKTEGQLRDDLLEMLSKFTDTNQRHSASSDLLAATIETSLIKLSHIRARVHQALYDSKSPTDPETTVSKALSTAHAKLKRDERKLEEEERELDRQIGEYETVLRLVDGGGGGFAQVVEDWTRVQREKEECRRDLRRLGWTGD